MKTGKTSKKMQRVSGPKAPTYMSPGKGQQKKMSGVKAPSYMSPGTGQQGKVGKDKNNFKTMNNSPETKKA
jgi:hypothetical protein